MRWIRVADRLPENEEEVEIKRANGFVCDGHILNNWWVFEPNISAANFLSEVTHWRPKEALKKLEEV